MAAEVSIQERARRIAIVMHGFFGGGIESSMLRLAEGFLDRGLAVDFLVGKVGGELRHRVPTSVGVTELAKVTVLRAWPYALMADRAAWPLLLPPMGTLKPLVRRLPSLVRYLRQARPDAVLAAGPHYNVMAQWAQKLGGSAGRVVISEHNKVSQDAASGNLWGEPRLRALLRRAYLAADGIIAVSDGLADDLARHGAIPCERITTVYNPVVGVDLLARAEEPVDHPWFAPGAPPVILAVGRLHPQKDFATLIRAFAKLRRRPVRLVILGAVSRPNPGYAEELSALAEALGVADNVAMPGFVDNPFAFMARAAVFVLSSRYEGLSVALIEALACGCPVVSTDCPSGPSEILEHGRFGPLVSVGDYAALAQAIEAVLDQPLPAEILRERAGHFSVHQAVDQYLQLLLDALLPSTHAPN
jgi:glycosyltransferase involved in cell wall biosynthesis